MKVLGVEYIIHSHMNILKALTYPSITFHFSGPTEGAGDGILSVGLVVYGCVFAVVYRHVELR